MNAVIIAFPIGFLLMIDNCIIPSVIDLEIKSKVAVSPLIIHPIAINPSYFLISLDIATGISKAMNTTFLGLLAAISIMMLHTFLSSKSEKIVNEIDEFSVKLLDLLGTKNEKAQ